MKQPFFVENTGQSGQSSLSTLLEYYTPSEIRMQLSDMLRHSIQPDTPAEVIQEQILFISLVCEALSAEALEA